MGNKSLPLLSEGQSLNGRGSVFTQLISCGMDLEKRFPLGLSANLRLAFCFLKMTLGWLLQCRTGCRNKPHACFLSNMLLSWPNPAHPEPASWSGCKTPFAKRQILANSCKRCMTNYRKDFSTRAREVGTLKRDSVKVRSTLGCCKLLNAHMEAWARIPKTRVERGVWWCTPIISVLGTGGKRIPEARWHASRVTKSVSYIRPWLKK